MVRTQVELTDEQSEALASLAAREHVSLGEMVHRAVDLLIQTQHEPKRPDVRRRAIAAAGRYASDRHDVSEAHDQYLAQAYRS
ncbi:MAG: CopG family transcriptional regulator [bacterium]|nr:CopG family transcriptional regulator [bacterium]